MSDPSSITPSAFAASVLERLHIKRTPGAVQALVGWQKAEGGHWHNDAKYNPLNTTQPMSGAGNTGSQGNIKVYKNWQQGIEATVKTLENGHYAPILNALKQGSAGAVASAIGKTPWGTNGALVARTIGATSPTSAAPISGGGPGAQSVTLETPKLDTAFDQAGYDRARRRTIVGNLIARHDPSSLLITSGVLQPGRLPSQSDFTTSQVTTQKSTFTLPRVDRQNATGVVTAAKLVDRADAIDAKHLPYQWGGGHGGKVNAYSATPLDCSGAVSAVLGINPRVSGDFEKWGQPGAGGNVTVYANGEHVLMKLRGRDGNWHFFGTSASNPGGGAGWIPADKISPNYLKNFTARHQ